MTISARRVPSLLVAGLVAALLAVLVVPGTAQAFSGLVAAMNGERAAVGVAPLMRVGELDRVAQAWSEEMARTGRLSHNPDYSRQITNWSALAENVAYAGSEETAHTALMASEGHRRNILNPQYTEVGVGVAVVNGRVWVTEVFRRPIVPSAPVLYLSRHRPDIYRLVDNRPETITGAQWASYGYATPRATNTEYVKYPWSPGIHAVTYWPVAWQWEALSFASWERTGFSPPRAAGWIEGSTIYKHANQAPIYLSDPMGVVKHLTLAEWAATGYRAPAIR